MHESAPETPSQEPINAIPPQGNTGQENPEPPRGMPSPNLSPSVERQYKTEHCRPDQTPWWKHLMEGAAIMLGIAVAIIYYRQLDAMQGQLTEMSRQTILLTEQSNRAVIEYAGNSATASEQLKIVQQQLNSLQRANEITIENQRPWIAYITQPPGEEFDFKWITDKQGVWALVSYTWLTKNGGRRPARIERSGTTARWEDEINCSTHPDYSFLPPDSHFVPPRSLIEDRGGEILLSDDTDKSSMTRYVPRLRWEDFESHRPKHVFCVYAFVEYRDVLYPKIVHHTQACRFYGRLGEGKFSFLECTNGYGKAD